MNGVTTNAELNPAVAPLSSPRPGRPRSEARRAAILAAAGELMLAGGLPAATMEAIAERAGVSKATIYKWWPSRSAVALEGFMVSVADSWSLPEELPSPRALYVLMRNAVSLFNEGPAGPLMRALAADAQSQPELAQALRERWFGPRRALAAAVIDRGIERGELRPDLNLAATLDALFGPIYYRLLFSHEPLDEAFASQLIDQVLRGIAATTE